MHDDTVEGVIGQLERELRIPRRQIANLTFIVPMHVGRDGGIIRRVQEVAFLRPNGDDLSVGRLADWEPAKDQFSLFGDPAQKRAFASWAGLSPETLDAEIARREEFLETLSRTG